MNILGTNRFWWARFWGVAMALFAALGVGFAAETFVKDLSSAGSITVTATAAHPTDGSVYVIGNFDAAPLTIGGITLPLYGGKKTGFIAKMGADGGWRWAGQLADSDGRGSLVPRNLSVTANNVFITGDATNGVNVVVKNGPNSFTGSQIRNNNSRAPFVIKLDTEGRYVWAAMASNTETSTVAGDPEGSNAFANDIAVDGVGSVFICGSFSSNQITDDPNLGLNFGSNHAFRIRDTSGTATSGYDWNHQTRDGFVAKLDANGNWKWVATGGSLENGPSAGFFGIAVDSVSNVYVVGNAQNGSNCRGGAFINAFCTAAAWNSNGLGGASAAGPDVPTENTVAYVARIGGSGAATDGKWFGVMKAFATGSKVGSGCPIWGSVETRARDVVWVDGSVYVSYYNQNDKDLNVVRLVQDLSAIEAIATVGGTANNDAAIGSSLTGDPASNLYVTGTTGFPGANFINANTSSKTVNTSLTQAPFFARLAGKTLEWQWILTANTPDIPSALPSFGAIVNAVDPQSKRLFVAGSFSNGILDLGPNSSDTVLPPSGVQGANARSFVTTIVPEGSFLEQVRFELITQFGASVAQPPQTPQTLLKGTSIIASAPAILYEDALGNSIDPRDENAVANRAVARHICLGYEVLDTAIAGDGTTFTFPITSDTRVRFNWKTEYAFDVKNNLAGSLGGLTSTAAGNPDPIVQKHWIQEGEIATAFMDGVIPSPNPNEYGTRYRSAGYQASGAANAVLNRAVQLDGVNEMVDIGALPAVNFAGGVTVEAWVKADRIVDWGGILETASANGQNTLFLANAGTSRDLNFRVYQGSSVAAAVTAANVLSTGVWTHVAATLDLAGNATIYINGQSVATTANGSGKLPPSIIRERTYIGWGPASALSFFAGKIAEVRLWNTARTGDQIRTWMLAPLTTGEPGLAGYWRLADLQAVGNPATSFVTTDSSGKGLTGTLANGDASNLAPAFFTNFYAWPSVQSRQQVPQFVMAGPAAIEYRWVKENRMQVSVSSAALANVPFVVAGGATNAGAGEYWFAHNTPMRVYAPETASAGSESFQLKGFLGGLGNITTVTGDGTKINGYRYYDIAGLTLGSAITWDYSDRIYKGKVFIGDPMNFAAGGTFVGSEAIPASDQLDTGRAPLSGTIVSGTPPGSTIEDMRIWDDVADKLYPLRPGVILLEWARQSGSSSQRSIFTEITIAFPTNAHFTHIANTPPVPLDSDKTNAVTFLALKYSQSDKTRISDAKEFSAQDTAFTDPFWSVLLFSERSNNTPANGDLTQEKLRVRTVLTKKWDSGLQLANATIGAPVASGLHGAGVPHNGFVYFEKARYNAGLHNRASSLGPIIPVNLNPGARLDENLVVVWYKTQEGIHWPYQAVQYTPQWPVTASRIVIASRLGSEGIDSTGLPQLSFDPARYSDVAIYNQPDPALPGYNPNEEHALIAPSLLNASAPTPPPTAYALRNNLNVTNLNTTYTSDPYVLVQYFDKSATNWSMAVYNVQNDDINVPARRLDFALSSAQNNFISLGTGGVVEFNSTLFQNSTGLRPLEPVNLEVNDNLFGVNSGRYFLVRSNDNKFLLTVTTNGSPITAKSVTPSQFPMVTVSRAYPYVFEYEMKAGQPVQAPYPLQLVIGATPCPDTRGENLDPNQLVYWEDHKKQPWAISGSTNPAAGLRAQFYYALQPNFWHPALPAGSCIAYVSNAVPVWVTNHVSWPVNIPILKAGETLTFSGGENNRDNPNAAGLPGVIGWAAGRVVYDDANPSMNLAKTASSYMARLASPLTALQVPVPIGKFPPALQPAAGKVNVNGAEWTFTDLDASLQPRVFYNSISQKLGVRGFVDDKTLGDPALTASPGSISVLQPNILTSRDSNALVSLVAPATDDWINAISNLVKLSRDPQGAAGGGYGVGLAPTGTNGFAQPATQFGPGLALLPSPLFADPLSTIKDGYVTLAENDDPSLGDAPVALHIIKLQKQPMFRGAIKTINPPNPFDEKITLRHSGDFGANAGDLVFEWYYRPDDGAVVPPPDAAQAGVWSLFADVTGNGGRGMSEINLAGAGAVTLSDNRFFVRWRHSSSAGVWSQWAGAANSRPPASGELPQNTYVPQSAEGWVKRVTGAINPFDSRVSDFRNNNSPATYASMVRQAGAPYRGNVALNSDKDVVENVGLIELYSTVIDRAKKLSIDLSTPITTPAVNNAILLAASRIADLQLLLGNEAYTDAQDPTIGFGTGSVEYGALAPTIFCFQNQVGTLLDEELALLRGRPEEGAYPAYNRLLWNFTRAEGEAAYALSYSITDINSDGFINEADARLLYPQGHGDAWGQYLSALRTYYDLLRHPYFNWQARAERLSIEGVVLNVDYLDERKFAQAAAAKAKAGAEIVNLTYRSRFVEDPDGQWQGYQDTDASRAWGVADWARRAGTGALFDWATANAILPAADTNHTGVEKVDRSTVKELSEISAQALEIRKQLDNANIGLNPIGLATDVVPFDIDPTGFDSGGADRAMHFDQVYDRALKAMQNAVDVFNNANQLNNMLRQVAATADQFAQQAQDQDLDYRNRLIEIFGTPYEGTIGAGKAYPAGYTGPDLYLYMYVDVTGLQQIPEPSTDFTAYFGTINGGLVGEDNPGGGGKSIKEVWKHYFTTDAPNIEDNTKTDFSDVLTLKMPQTASGYSFQAPSDWGSRRSPGQIQQTLSELVQAEADLQLALHDYDGLVGDVKDMMILIKAQSDLQEEQIRIANKGIDQTIGFNVGISVARVASATSEFAANITDETADIIADSLPKIVGALGADVTGPGRAASRLGGLAASKGFASFAFAAEQIATGLESAKEILALQNERDIQKADFKYAIQEQLKELEGLLGDESAKRIEVFRKQEALRQVSDKYRALLDSGLRLLDERELHNKRTAGAAQQNRYQDFTFRVARNDALSKYRAAFDLAARYAYLAAKAYDYETNLDPNDPASARPILTQIIRARTLGAMDNGAPRLGSGGLADALATMKVNFDVLKTQMGFNNPQTETGRFSLRTELFRIASGPMLNGARDTSTNIVSYGGQNMSAAAAWAASDSKWRDALQNGSGGGYSAKVIPDLWQIPEFRRYCRPFAPESAGAQPGLVITFGTQIVFGKNFFGWPLGGGDSAYDPSHFATKVRSVGLWFENYNGEGLSLTPRAYLIPAGLDIMLVPTSLELATREWNVIDQKIPIPLPVSQSNLRDPNWIPLRDSLNGSIAEIRRYSMFRAYHDAGFATDQMTSDSRLVGRSVWNTRWMLIIPGGTFLASAQEGLDTFIRGRVVPGSSPAVRDGNGVKDIKLFFQTYAYSGN